jgi:recombination protein RecT
MGTEAIQKRNPAADKEAGLVELVKSMQVELARALPKHLTADRMARIVTTTLRQDAMKPSGLRIIDCDRWSFAGAVMTAASLGLEVNTPLQHAYLIPRKIKGENTCTLQIGYQGLLQLARQSGQIDAIWGHAVYQGDHFVQRLGLENTFEHEPKGEEDPKKLTHVYACARLKNVKEPVFVILTRKQVDAARARGGERGFSPWDTDYVAMAQKTALRRLCKWLPLSLEMAQAVQLDEVQERGNRQVRSFAAIPEIGEALEARGMLTEGEPADDEAPESDDPKPTKAQAVEAEILGGKKPASAPKNAKPAEPDADPEASQVLREALAEQMAEASTLQELQDAGTAVGKAHLTQEDKDSLRAYYAQNLKRINASKSSPRATEREPGED